MKEIKVKDKEKEITLEVINALENRKSIKFPKDYTAHLLTHNGGHPITDTYDFVEGNFINSSDVAWFYALYDGYDENLEKKIDIYNNLGRMPKEFVPIGRDSCGNQICLCVQGKNYGKVYFWNHEEEADEGKEPTYDNLYLIANSFTDFINSLYEFKIPE